MRKHIGAIVTGLAIVVGLLLASRYHYLLFHTLAEGFSIVVASAMFLVAWNTWDISDNGYLKFLGIAFLFVGGIDAVHTLAYKGMDIFQGYDANLPTQLWIAARYMQSLSLLIAPTFLKRKIDRRWLVSIYAILTAILLGLIFAEGGVFRFPDCYIEGQGLTTFKIVSEYVISLMLGLALLRLFRQRTALGAETMRWIPAAIVFSILSELAFTVYVGVYDLPNLIGHIFKIAAMYSIYRAIVKTGLQKPFEFLFHNLQAREALYHQMFAEQSATMLLIAPESGAIVEANPAAARFYGYPLKDLQQMTIDQINTLPPEAIAEARHEALISTHDHFIFQHRLASGELRDVEVHSVPIQVGDQTVLYSIIHDITDRKQAEQALQQSLIDLELAQQIAHIGNWQFDPDIGIPVWSEEVYRIYNRDPHLGPPHIDEYQNMYAANQFDIFNTAIQKAIQHGDPYDITLKLKLPGGVIKWIHAICRPDAESGPSGHFLRGTIQDITERKQAEAALAASEAELSAIVESSPFAMMIVDREWRVHKIKDRGQEFIPDAAGLLGLRCGETLCCVHVDDDAQGCGFGPACQDCLLRRTALETIENGTSYYAVETTMTFAREDKCEEKTVLIYTTPLILDGKRQALLVLQDITERKQIEQQNQLLATIIKQSQDFIGVTDPEQHALYVNLAGQAMVGLEGDDAVKQSKIEDYFLPEDLPFVEQTILPALKTQGRWVGEFRFRHFKTGEPIPVLYDLFRTEDPETGQVTNYATVTRDITERKQAEQALRESEARYRLLFETNNDFVFLHPISTPDAPQPFLEVNTSACQRLGYSPEEIGLLGPLDIVRDIDLANVPTEANQLVDEGTLLFEKNLVAKDGHLIPVELNARIFEFQGQQMVLSIGRDITERKQMEAALRESEAKFRLIAETSAEDIWQLDRNGNVIYVSPAVERIFGYTPEQALQLDFSIFFAESDLEKAKAAFINAISGVPYQLLEFTGKRKDGDTIPIEVSVTPIVKDDHIIGVQGIARDITERKRMEAALHESERRYREIAANIPGVVYQFCIHPDGNYTVPYMSEGGASLFERPLADVMAPNSMFVDIHPDDLDGFLESIEAAARDHRQWTNESRIVTPKGKVKWLRGSSNPRQMPDGSLLWDGVLFDITERKQAEKKLHQFTERLQILHNIDAAILAAQSPQDIASAAMTHLRDLISCRFASISEIDTAQEQGRDFVILSEDQISSAAGQWYPLAGLEAMMNHFKQGEVHLIHNIAELDTHTFLEEWLLDRNMHTYVSIPLMIQETPIGALSVAAEAPGFFEPTHVEILQEIANSLAIALQQARLLAQTREDADTKAMLLREVNHRVLNNLSMIQGLVMMEQRRPLANATDFQATMRELYNRLEGLILVHRMLSSAQWTPLELNTLIEKVVHAALSSSPIYHALDVAVHAPPDPLQVSAKQAIAVAMIFNELATNSAKYAFPARSQGHIRVDIAVEENETKEQNARPQVQLIYRDDGVGWPDAVLAEGKREKIGVWLVESSVQYTLNGDITLYNDQGAVTEITFRPAPTD